MCMEIPSISPLSRLTFICRSRVPASVDLQPIRVGLYWHTVSVSRNAQFCRFLSQVTFVVIINSILDIDMVN